MNEIIVTRDVNIIASEIRLIQQDVQQYASQAAMKIGERLTEAKDLVPYGEWGEWIKTEFGWSQDRANQLMAIYREYGGTQKNIFGAELNSDTYRNLSFSKLLALISVPESEREDFVKDNDVETISVRELKKLIAEKEKAEATAKAASEAAEKHGSAAEKLREQLEAALEAADTDKSALESKIKELENRPAQVIKQKDETAIKVAVAKAEESAKKKHEKEIAALKKEVETATAQAEAEKENTRQAAAEAQKLSAQLKQMQTKKAMSSPEVAAFKVYFEDVQKCVEKMRGLIKQIETVDAETAGKLRNAFHALAANMEAGI